MPGPKILATRSVFYPDTEEMMGRNVSQDGFRIVLSPEVPALIQRNLGKDVDSFLAELGRERSDVGSWVLHTGGPKVLEATASALGLKNGELSASWGPHCQLYVTPVGPAEVCVALISKDPGLRLDHALEAFPQVAERLSNARHGSVERGAASVTRKLTRVCAGNVALVGDASGGVDAITGEGLCLAFHQADLLADCLVSSDMSVYQCGHRALARRPALMAHLMLLLENRRLRKRVMRAFVTKPELFVHMLATHVGASSPLAAAANGLALGWGLLTT